MRFIVYRTSGSWDVKYDKPCIEAFQEQITYPETYRNKSPEEFDKKVAAKRGLKTWFDEGINHRLDEEGFITRDRYVTVWMIEINTVKDFINMHSKYGELILDQWYMNKDYWSIEIYDDYRE